MASTTSSRARLNPQGMKIGRNVVVIGAGNTADRLRDHRQAPGRETTSPWSTAARIRR